MKPGNAPIPSADFAARVGHRLESLLPPRFRGRFGRRFRRTDMRYLDPLVPDIRGLSAALTSAGAAHAVIEPIEALRATAPVPIVLLADEHLPLVARWTTPWPVGQRVEVYSPSGLPGFAFGDMPYMPPEFALRILQNTPAGASFRQASPRDTFLAGLYRALYLSPHEPHAAPASLFSDLHPALAAKRYGFETSDWSSLADMDAFMERQGWRPPLDMLERIGCWNPWVAEQLRGEGNWPGAERPGPAVFYIRQTAIEQGKLDLILRNLSSVGFCILPVPELDSDQLAAVARHVRGGNWGRGPYPRSGGVPGRVILGFDEAPIAPDDGLLEQFPLLDNARIQMAKRVVRDAVQADLPRGARYNAMHSTDNAVQAWRAIGEMWPDLTEQLRTQVSR